MTLNFTCFQRSKRNLLTSSIIPCILLAAACNNKPDSQKADNLGSSDSLTEEQKHDPENALKGLVTFEGLEVHAMATEPMLKNPTNIDVDDRGRVWVTEA